MSAHGFTSAFAQELDAYLAFKEKMGFYGSSRIWYLKRFDAYCSARARTVFDRDCQPSRNSLFEADFRHVIP
jgi:hypothetical protein